MAEALKVYERQSGESVQAWNAFRIYRDLGAKRSLDAVAQRLREDAASRSAPHHPAAPREQDEGAPKPAKRRSGRLSNWSVKWRWVARAAEWDRVRDREWRRRQFEVIEQTARRQAKQAELAAAALMRPVIEYALLYQDRERLLQVAGVSDPATPDAVLLTSPPVARLFGSVVNTAALLPKVCAAERIALGVVKARDPFLLRPGQKPVVLAAPAQQPRAALSQSGGTELGRQSCPPDAAIGWHENDIALGRSRPASNGSSCSEHRDCPEATTAAVTPLRSETSPVPTDVALA